MGNEPKHYCHPILGGRAGLIWTTVDPDANNQAMLDPDTNKQSDVGSRYEQAERCWIPMRTTRAMLVPEADEIDGRTDPGAPAEFC